jgi:DNA polymerase-3 subunit gamma/tau
MSYLVISRKYRPQRFNEVVGQSHISLTLQNAIKSNRISHAYLFTGSRGIGKTSTARILAKSLNCLNPTKGYNPCNECQNCIEITAGRSIDVLEIDGASNRGIDQIRDLRENVKYPPSNSKYRIFIIDEVHMLTKEAFNALLKTLEEPPEHTIFIFATTEPQKIPATIISRCQRYDFRRIPTSQIVSQLKNITESENIEVPESVLIILAKKSEGSMRDAESLLDQLISFSGGKITEESAKQILGLIDFEYLIKVGNIIHNKDQKSLLQIAEEIFSSGIDIGDFLNSLSEHFRNLLAVKISGSADVLELPEDTKTQYAGESEKWDSKDLLRLINIVSDSQIRLKSSLNHRTHLEFTLLKMGAMDNAVTIQEILGKLNSINIPKSIPSYQTGEVLNIFDNGYSTERNKGKSSSNIVKESSLIQLGKTEKKKKSLFNSSNQNNSATDTITIEVAKKKWSEIVKIIDETNPSLANFIKESIPLSIKRNILTIGFHGDNSFGMENAISRVNIIENAINKALNRSLKVKCVISNDAPNNQSDTEEFENAIKLIVDTFNGEIISK